eukprot:310071-Pyramimonas_sp.AAC.1
MAQVGAQVFGPLRHLDLDARQQERVLLDLDLVGCVRHREESLWRCSDAQDQHAMPRSGGHTL